VTARGRWRWFVEGYYADDVAPPKEPSGFAIRVGGVTREALRRDVEALERRPDIGEIVGPYEAAS